MELAKRFVADATGSNVNAVHGKIASEKEEKTEENAADTEEKAAEVSEQNA